MASTGQAFQGVPQYLTDSKTHRAQLARAVNTLTQGKFNCSVAVTLATNSATTTITDSRIGYNSIFVWMPQTTAAATEFASGNMYVPQSTIVAATHTTPGTAVLHHTNSATAGRTFLVGILG